MGEGAGEGLAAHLETGYNNCLSDQYGPCFGTSSGYLYCIFFCHLWYEEVELGWYNYFVAHTSGSFLRLALLLRKTLPLGPPGNLGRDSR